MKNKNPLFSRFIRRHTLGRVIGNEFGVLKLKGFFGKHVGTFIFLNLSIFFVFELSTASAHTMTVSGATQVSQIITQAGFAQSGLFGITDNLTTPFVTDLDITTGDFTVETWVYPTADALNGMIGILPNADFGWNLALYNGVGAPRGRVEVDNAACNANDYSNNPTAAMTKNAWHHIGFERIGSTFYYFEDGAMFNILTKSDAMCKKTTQINIGNQAAGGNNGIKGNMDEVRISKVARYKTTASYRIPTGPFCGDRDTILLLHMDGADGSSSFPDDFQKTCPKEINDIF